MKAIILAITLMLGMTSFSQTDGFLLGRLSNVTVATYNNDHVLVDDYSIEANATWVYDTTNQVLVFTEKTLDNKTLLNRKEEEVLSVQVEDDYSIVQVKDKNNDIYDYFFWFNGKKVAYMSKDGYVIMNAIN